MAELFTGIRPVYTFADKGLFQYEKIAARKLGDILEQLELGEGANLGLQTVRFKPDDIATISIKVMEGILSPIILIDIDRQVSDKAKDEEDQEIELPEEEIRWYYSPSIWFGVVSKNHDLEAVGNNTNCDFWGYPPSARIWAFEPFAENGTDFEGNQYGYLNTVESIPGSIAQCGLPSWGFGKEDQAGVFEQQRFEIFNDVSPGFGFQVGDGADELGFFGWQDWYLIEGIIRSKSGMTLFEGPGCYQTAPRDALVPLGQAGQLNELFDDDAYLPTNYWERSVIVAPSFSFGSDPNAPDDPITVQHVFPAIRTDDLPAGGDLGVTFDIEFPQGEIFNTVLSGEYEFNIFALQFECECVNADISARLVLGQKITELEELNDQTTVTYKAIIQIVDFDFPNIGDWKTSQTVLCRDHTLGGHGECDEFQDRGMLDSNGRGINQDAIYVNPLAGTWRVAQASFRQPFFNDGAPGSNCPQDTGGLANDVLCQSCSFTPYMTQTGFGWANGGYNCLHSSQGGGGAGSVGDTRDGLSFHLARVVGIEAPSNRICHVQMVGNDGGEGNNGSPCGNDPLGVYSYGHVFFATGIDPSIPIGTDLPSSGLPTLDGGPFGTPGEIGGWQLHELVVVVGFAFTTGPCVIGNCNKSFGERLLVSKLDAGGENFRLFYWQAYRCASGTVFRSFVDTMEEQSQITDQCAGEKALTYQNFTESGITYGGFAPTDSAFG